MACGTQLYLCVHVGCLAITVEHLVVSPLYICFIQSLLAIATTSDDISILACEDEAHLTAFTEQDEEFYEFALEVAGTLTVMAEVLMWTLGVS